MDSTYIYEKLNSIKPPFFTITFPGTIIKPEAFTPTHKEDTIRVLTEKKSGGQTKKIMIFG